MGKLQELTIACSDTCCEGLNNPMDHVIRKVFPYMTKWPLADTFHKVQIGTDSMVAGHEDYAQACRYCLRVSYFEAQVLRLVQFAMIRHLATHRDLKDPAPVPIRSEMGGIMAERSQRDVFRCAMSLVEQGSSAKDAIAKALGPWGKRYIRTSTPEDLDEQLGKWVTKWSKRNAELIAAGKKPLFR